MSIIKLTERALIESVLSRWNDRYPDDSYKLAGGETAGEVRKRIESLDLHTCSATDVNNTIRRPDWATLICDECEEESTELVRIRSESDYEPRWQDLCAKCIDRARTVLCGSPPTTTSSIMSKSAFTPGPWRVEKPEDELIKFRVHYIGERPTVEIWTDGKDGFYQPVALVADDDEANARLIAAAPDLYEALAEAVTFENDDPECHSVPHSGVFDEEEREECPDHRCHEHGCMVARVNRWRAVLARARGEH